MDPATVPKLMDVITPPGVDQSDEVDYTIHTPVVLSGVAIPDHVPRRSTQILSPIGAGDEELNSARDVA